MWFLLQRDGNVPTYSRSLAVRGEVGARSSKRVRRAREKMTAARDLSLCHVISPSFQWVGLRLFVRFAEATGSARPARRGRQRWTIARNEHAQGPTPCRVVFCEKMKNQYGMAEGPGSARSPATKERYGGYRLGAE